MHYVYILQSVGAGDRYYIGATEDLKARFAKHNAGEVCTRPNIVHGY
jgi:predicted GIY-YIG superfamily endonuclease